MRTNNLLSKVTLPIIGLLLMLLYFTGCSQPIQGVPDTTSEQEGFSLNFNYSMTGAFDRAVTRASELNRAKMYITDLVTGKTERHDWIVLIDKETMEATSYSTVALNMGKYSFELVVTRGSYNYYAKSGPIELKNGANNIPLKLTPVIGDFISDTATVTDLSCISNLVYKFSTVQLAMVNDPRLGYSINGSEEIIIKLNKTTGLAPVKVCLPDGTYPIELKFYDGTTLLGTNLKKKEIYISAAFTTSTIDLYPLYGDCSFDISSGTGEADVKIRVPDEVVKAVRSKIAFRGYSIVTIKYADRTIKEFFGFDYSSPEGTFLTGKLKDLSYGKADITVDILAESYDFNTILRIARASLKDVTIGEQAVKLDLPFQIFPSNTVDVNIRSIVNLTMFTTEGNPLFSRDSRDFDFFVDGYYLSNEHVEIRGNSRILAIRPESKKLEVRVKGDYYIKSNAKPYNIKSFDLSLKPFEIKNISYTFELPAAWQRVQGGDFVNGLPLPFDNDLFKLGNRYLRFRQEGNLLKSEMINTAGSEWVKAAPDFILEESERFIFKTERMAVDSKGRLNLATVTKSALTNYRMLRLAADLSSWELISLPQNINSSNIFTNTEGEILTATLGDSSLIKRLKVDDSGWEVYNIADLPAVSEKNEYPLDRITGIFSSANGALYAYAGYQAFDMLLRYDESAKKWIEIDQLSSNIGYNITSHSFDNRGNYYSTYFYSYSQYAPGGTTIYESLFNFYLIDKNGNRRFGARAQRLEDLDLGSMDCRGYNGRGYVTARANSWMTPYLATFTINSTAPEEILPEDMPIMERGFTPEIAFNAKGDFFLKYHNSSTGKSYYYRKK